MTTEQAFAQVKRIADAKRILDVIFAKGHCGMNVAGLSAFFLDEVAEILDEQGFDKATISAIDRIVDGFQQIARDPEMGEKSRQFAEARSIKSHSFCCKPQEG